MKATDKPQISSKWWNSEKPADVKGADLAKALASAEKALADEKKKSDDASVNACLAAMEALETAVEKTIKKECDKKTHKDCIAVLEKFEDLIEDERTRLEEAQADNGDGEGDEEEDENKLFEKDYLYRMIKLMKGGGKELRFGFGLNTQEPEASKLVLTRKGKPEKLFKLLKRTGDFNNRTLTYGFAAPDAEQKKTLVFRLEESAGEPPQVIKLGRRFLRADKMLYFRKLKLVMPGGQTVVDEEPDTEDTDGAADGAVAGGGAGGGGQGDLSKELKAVQNLSAAWKQTLSDVSSQIDKLRKAIDGQNNAGLRPVSDGLGNVMKQFPDLDLSKLEAAAKSNDRAAYNQTLSQTTKEVGDVRRMLADGPLLSTIDENPFVKTTVHQAVKSLLARVSSELSIKA
jgi:hypothetical protein